MIPRSAEDARHITSGVGLVVLASDVRRVEWSLHDKSYMEAAWGALCGIGMATDELPTCPFPPQLYSTTAQSLTGEILHAACGSKSSIRGARGRIAVNAGTTKNISQLIAKSVNSVKDTTARTGICIKE